MARYLLPDGVRVSDGRIAVITERPGDTAEDHRCGTRLRRAADGRAICCVLPWWHDGEHRDHLARARTRK